MNTNAFGWMKIIGAGASGASAAIMSTEVITTRVVVVAVLGFLVSAGIAASALYQTKPGDAIPPAQKKDGAA